MQHPYSILWLLILLCCSEAPVSALRDSVRYCLLGDVPIVSLGLDNESDSIFVVESNITAESNSTRRCQESQEAVPAIFVQSAPRKGLLRALVGRNESQGNFTVIAQVRECTCALITSRGSFCPSDKDTCEMAADGSISCYIASTRVSILRNTWPIVLMWYGVALMFLLFTEQGVNARRYVRLCLCSDRLNTDIANRMVRNEFERRTWRRRQRSNDVPSDGGNPQLEHEDSVRRPQRLALKTKRFCRPCAGENDEDEDEDYNCSICFVALHDGDRVGALACNHLFHVECLKLWIQRKNACPLCQEPNVAKAFQTDSNSQSDSSEQRDRSRLSIDDNRDSGGDQNLRRPFAGRVILYGIRRWNNWNMAHWLWERERIVRTQQIFMTHHGPNSKANRGLAPETGLHCICSSLQQNCSLCLCTLSGGTFRLQVENSSWRKWYEHERVLRLTYEHERGDKKW